MGEPSSLGVRVKAFLQVYMASVSGLLGAAAKHSHLIDSFTLWRQDLASLRRPKEQAYVAFPCGFTF